MDIDKAIAEKELILAQGMSEMHKLLQTSYQINWELQFGTWRHDEIIIPLVKIADTAEHLSYNINRLRKTINTMKELRDKQAKLEARKIHLNNVIDYLSDCLGFPWIIRAILSGRQNSKTLVDYNHTNR